MRLQWTKKEIRKEKRKKILGMSLAVTYAKGFRHAAETEYNVVHYTSKACDLLHLRTAISSYS